MTQEPLAGGTVQRRVRRLLTIFVTSRKSPKGAAMYRYVCTACGHVRYGDQLLSTSTCRGCRAMKFGLQKRVWIKADICPRCKKEFHKEHFLICGGCLTDMDRANRGLPPSHFKTPNGEVRGATPTGGASSAAASTVVLCASARKEEM